MVVFNRCTFVGGGAPLSVGNIASDFANACAMQSKFLGEPLRTENVGDRTSLNFSHREQAYHEANTSVLANSGIQPYGSSQELEMGALQQNLTMCPRDGQTKEMLK